MSNLRYELVDVESTTIIDKKLADEIIKKLKTNQQRNEQIEKAKARRFSKAAWFHIDVEETELNRTDNLNMLSFLNDNVLTNRIDNYESDLVTWEEYAKVKMELEKIESDMNTMINKFLDLYYNTNLSS